MIEELKNFILATKANNYRPKLLEGHFLLYLVFSVLALKLIALVMLFPVAFNVFFADIAKTELISMLNQNRQSVSLHTLEENEQLNRAAFLKAQDMIGNNYFSHISPQGVTPWFWISNVGYKYRYAGENLAVGFIDSENLYRAWHNSVSHRQNLLNPNYTEVGTAIVRGFGDNDAVVVVQLFASPLASSQNVLASGAESNQPEQNSEAPQEVLSQEIVLQETSKEPVSTEDLREAKQEEVLAKAQQGLFPALTEPGNKSNNYNKFLNFVIGINEGRAMRYIIHGLTLLLSVILLINIILGAKNQKSNLIFKTLLLIATLQMSVLINENLASQIFPSYIIL